jgi:hypothetical protein
VTAAVAAPPAVADLILVRMALPNPTPKRVREDVCKLLGTDLSTGDFAAARAELADAGSLEKRPRNAFVLTDAGRERALRFLGLSELPPRANWGTVIAKYLFPTAAGLSPEAAAKLNDGDKLAAFVLKRKYGLSGGSTVRQVLEGLVCKELGYPAETTLAGLARAVLSKLIGSDERLTMEKLAVQVPLFETGLAAVSADALRYKLVRDWLADGAAAPRPAEPRPAEPFDLSDFAATVRKLAATSPPQDRFHDNKVFIAPLWRASQREPNFPRLSLPEFKQRLVEANARHLLHLSRADLVSAMDPQFVAESETTHLNATFHFVLLEGDRP